jgi:hypothetical protein
MEGKTMNKIKTIVTSVMAVAAIFLGVATLMIVAPKPPSTAVKGAETVKQVEAAPATELSFTATKGRSVLDQLKQQAKVETQDSAYGPFVSAINGVKGGEGGKYWSYYVNDALAQKGAADYITVGGEKITWKLE